MDVARILEATKRISAAAKGNRYAKWIAAIVVLVLVGIELYVIVKHGTFSKPDEVKKIGDCKSLSLGGSSRVSICKDGIHIGEFIKVNNTRYQATIRGTKLCKKQWFQLLNLSRWITLNVLTDVKY